MEIAAFIKLRLKKPDLHRPYRVPLGTTGAILVSLPPTLLLLLVMCLASARTVIISGIVIVFGFLLYPAIQFMKDKKWFKFISPPIPPESCFEALPIRQEEVFEEVSVSLLPDKSADNDLQNSEFNSEEILKLE